MEEEAANELGDRDSHHLSLVTTTFPVVLPAEADVGLIEIEQATVGDRDAMGVAREIGQDLLGTGEGLFGIDEPFGCAQRRESGRHQSKIMRLDVGEFMRRFLLHVLPTGFRRIRHYGLFANGHRAEKLELCQRLLNVPSTSTDRANNDDGTGSTASDHEPPPCPCCGGRMIIIERFNGPLSQPYYARKLDGL